MTEQQQAILALFNTKDAANMEIAQECAIQVGLGRWFNRYINKQIAKISLTINRYKGIAIDTRYCEGVTSEDIVFSEKDEIRFLANAFIFFGCSLYCEPIRGEQEGWAYGSVVIPSIDNACIETTFDWFDFDMVPNLEAHGIIFKRFDL